MYKIWFSHGGKCEDYRLLGCDAIKKVYVPQLPTGLLAIIFFLSLCHLPCFPERLIFYPGGISSNLFRNVCQTAWRRLAEL